MDRRPPLAVSPRRLRPRRAPIRVSSDRTPPAPVPKSHLPIRSPVSKIQMSLPDYHLISSDLINLAKRAKEEVGNDENPSKFPDSPIRHTASPLFERGRFYELYSARRNERLKRKQGELVEAEEVAHDPGVAVELAKRRVAKKADGLRKSMPTNFSASRMSSLRSSVRSSKEMKLSSASGSYGKSVVDAGKKIGGRNLRKV